MYRSTSYVDTSRLLPRPVCAKPPFSEVVMAAAVPAAVAAVTDEDEGEAFADTSPDLAEPGAPPVAVTTAADRGGVITAAAPASALHRLSPLLMLMPNAPPSDCVASFLSVAVAVAVALALLAREDRPNQPGKPWRRLKPPGGSLSSSEALTVPPSWSCTSVEYM